MTPWQLDLTDEVRDRLADYFDDPDFEDSIGNSLALERNELLIDLGGKKFRDMFGVVWSREQKGDFGIVSEYLIKGTDIGRYRFPTADEQAIAMKCERLVAKRDRLYTIYTIGFSLFERAWTLTGMEELLTNFILEPEFVDELFDRIVDYNLRVIDIVSKYPIDCILFGDDWGQQHGLIMGPDHWRRFIKPRIERLYSTVKSHGMLVGQHSCGDISGIFSDLVGAGLDIYNTFQPEVYDIAEMKRLYGDRVTFYGGVSTQRVLPFATPDEVRAETRRLISLIGAGGGYICAPTHAIPSDVPTENILAFLETVRLPR